MPTVKDWEMELKIRIRALKILGYSEEEVANDPLVQLFLEQKEKVESEQEPQEL